MIAPRFNELIHAPNRLQICALLAPLDDVEFRILRKELGVSESVLSKHISKLEDAGYVSIRKMSVNGRQRTWAALTSLGRREFDAHIAELKRLAGLD